MKKTVRVLTECCMSAMAVSKNHGAKVKALMSTGHPGAFKETVRAAGGRLEMACVCQTR